MKYKYAIELDSEGNPVGYPLSVDNLKLIFSELTTESKLPTNYCWFEPVPKPRLGVFEKNQTHAYKMIGGICKDVWYSEPLSAEEKLQKIEEIRERWLNSGADPSWTISTTTGEPTPPVPKPQDDKLYSWNRETQSWIEYVEQPID